MIRLENLTRRFGRTVAVDRLNLQVPQGEFFAFLGPNGAGKTTTIKMMAGLLRPSEGTVCVDGFDIQRSPEQAKGRIGYIPDRPFLYEKLTAWEYLRFVAHLYRFPATEAERKMREWLTIFGLAERAGEYIESFSHGMRQKLVFASAFLHEPAAYVIDEPMVGLDPAGARLVKDLLKKEAAAGRTVFLSTHTLSVAEELADRIGIIHQGRLLALGTLEELRRQARAAQMRLEDLFLLLTEGRVPARGPAEDDGKVVRLG